MSTKEQEAQQARRIVDHASFAEKFKEFASEPQNELTKQSEEVLKIRISRAEKSLVDLQAQTMAEIRGRHNVGDRIRKRGDAHILTHDGPASEFADAHNDRAALLEIVDSQAQKIKEQSQTIAKNAAYAIELQGKISEQAKEIEKLKGIESELESVKRMSSGVAGYHLNGEIASWDEVGL